LVSTSSSNNKTKLGNGQTLSLRIPKKERKKDRKNCKFCEEPQQTNFFWTSCPTDTHHHHHHQTCMIIMIMFIITNRPLFFLFLGEANKKILITNSF
jgi:hypothetical protein